MRHHCAHIQASMPMEVNPLVIADVSLCKASRRIFVILTCKTAAMRIAAANVPSPHSRVSVRPSAIGGGAAQGIECAALVCAVAGTKTIV